MFSRFLDTARMLSGKASMERSRVCLSARLSVRQCSRKRVQQVKHVKGQVLGILKKRKNVKSQRSSFAVIGYAEAGRKIYVKSKF